MVGDHTLHERSIGIAMLHSLRHGSMCPQQSKHHGKLGHARHRDEGVSRHAEREERLVGYKPKANASWFDGGDGRFDRRGWIGQT